VVVTVPPERRLVADARQTRRQGAVLNEEIEVLPEAVVGDAVHTVIMTDPSQPDASDRQCSER
jgi:hypothetical protein